MTIKILHSKESYDAKCSWDSIALFNESLKHPKMLPGRLSHFKVTVLRLLLEPVSIASRVGIIAVEALTILFLPLSNEKYKLRSLAFRVTSLILLTPFDIIVGTAAGVTRIASSILGFASPSLCVRGWTLAEHMDFISLQLKASIWKKLTPNRTTTSIVLAKGKPERAKDYLSKATSYDLHRILYKNEIENATVALPRTILQATEALKRTDRMLYLEMFTTNNSMQKQHEIKEILEKIQVKKEAQDNSEETFMITENGIKALSQHEMNTLIRYIIKQVKTFQRNPKNANKIDESDANYKEYETYIYQTLENVSLCLKFGMTRYWE